MKLVLILLFPLFLMGSERIIALAPSISEIVFALGKGDELVGVSEYASYPPEVKKITKVGGYSNPSLEKIFALNPSLVIGQVHYAHTLRQLEKLGIKTLTVELSTIKHIKSSIKKIASALNTDPSELIKPINSALTEAKKHKGTKQRVLIVYGLSLDMQRGFYVAGHNIFYEDIIHACGAKNAYEGNLLSQPVLHYEGLIEANPDKVILLYHSATDGKIDFEKAKELWYNIPINAGRNKEVYIMNKTHLSIPSHRVALTITDICEVISL